MKLSKIFTKYIFSPFRVFFSKWIFAFFWLKIIKKTNYIYCWVEGNRKFAYISAFYEKFLISDIKYVNLNILSVHWNQILYALKWDRLSNSIQAWMPPKDFNFDKLKLLSGILKYQIISVVILSNFRTAFMNFQF